MAPHILYPSSPPPPALAPSYLAQLFTPKAQGRRSARETCPGRINPPGSRPRALTAQGPLAPLGPFSGPQCLARRAAASASSMPLAAPPRPARPAFPLPPPPPPPLPRGERAAGGA